MDSPEATGPAPPLFRAVTSSTRPLYQLLRCISFTDKIHVEITESGLRFAADNSCVMQGVAHWGKTLFTSYTTNFPTQEEDDEEATIPSFQISLPALLEALQIFGTVDAATRQSKGDVDGYRSNMRHHRPDVFSNQTLGMADTCAMSYALEGGPLSIVLEEGGVKTTCNLVTYLPESPEDIPFDIEDLSFKIITQSRWLLDALAEIAPTSPDKLTLVATRRAPYLRLSSWGSFGSSSVDFARGRDLLETMSIRDERWVQAFKFDMVRSASEAMRIASKVSLRGDAQGVLSMQFMVEVEGGGVNFLDFRFVPYAEHDEEEEEGEEEEYSEDDGGDGVA